MYSHATLTLEQRGMTDAGGAAEADASLMAVLRLNPGFAPAYIALVRIYLGDGHKVERALELVRKAVDIEPGNISYQMMLGSVLVRLGRYEAAMAFAKTMEQGARSQDEKNKVRSFVDGLRPVTPGRRPGKTPVKEFYSRSRTCTSICRREL